MQLSKFQLTDGGIFIPLTPKERDEFERMQAPRIVIEQFGANRSSQWNRFYWKFLVGAATSYCNQRLWNGRPLWTFQRLNTTTGEIEHIAGEVTTNDVHNIHLSLLGEQERIYAIVGDRPVISYRSTTRLKQSRKRANENEIDKDTFNEAVIKLWAELSGGELILKRYGEVDVKVYEED